MIDIKVVLIMIGVLGLLTTAIILDKPRYKRHVVNNKLTYLCDTIKVDNEIGVIRCLQNISNSTQQWQKKKLKS